MHDEYIVLRVAVGTFDHDRVLPGFDSGGDINQTVFVDLQRGQHRGVRHNTSARTDSGVIGSI